MMKPSSVLKSLIVILFLFAPAVGMAQWRSVNLEDKVLTYLQKSDASFSEAQDVLKSFVKDAREYDVKTAQVVQIVEDYANAHPQDLTVKEKARRLGNQAVEFFEKEKEKAQAEQVSMSTRFISAGAGGALGLALTFIPFVNNGAPEIVWVPPVLMLAGWFAAPAIANRLIKRIPLLRRAITYDDADVVVKKMTDFLGASAVCRGALNEPPPPQPQQ
jgi:hypothetical protein